MALKRSRRRPRCANAMRRSDLGAGDARELELFAKYLARRAAHPDAPAFHSHAEVYGQVVYEAKDEEQT